MATHHLEPNRRNLHGHFSRDLEPVLTIDSGDTVVYSTLDAGWHVDPEPWTGDMNWGRQIFERDPKLDAGHALCGPVAIRGAEPNMTLEVSIIRLRPGTWGWNAAGGGCSDVDEKLGVGGGGTEYFRWSLDPEKMIGRNQSGRTIRLSPFLGVMGMPPDAAGIHSTAPPRKWGGNMDCKELVVGTNLFLPIPVTGALFSAGDSHSGQGDGESSGTAIECPMERAELRLTVRPDISITTPQAKTPTAWVTIGVDEDLDQAAVIALNSMLDLMMTKFDCGRQEALSLASVAVDLRITQLVNGVRGVHAILRDDALTSRTTV